MEQLKVAINNNDIVEIGKILKSGVDIDRVEFNIGFYTPLGFATKKNKYDIVKYLLENGADVSCGRLRKSALHYAEKNQNIKIMKLLIEYYEKKLLAEQPKGLD